VVVKQTDIELLFERMAAASDLAMSAIADGILCRILVDPLGLVVDASHGSGEKKLSLRKIVGYSVLKSAKFDALGAVVAEVLQTLKSEVKVRVR